MARKRKAPPKPFYNKELAKMFDASDAAAYKSSALQPFKRAMKRHSTIYGNSWQNRQPLPPPTGAPSGPGRRTDTPPRPTSSNFRFRYWRNEDQDSTKQYFRTKKI